MEMLAEYVLRMPSSVISDPLPWLHELNGYIDPGMGSLMIQLGIGALAGALLAIKLFWGKIRKWSKNSLSHIRGSDESNGAKE